VSDEIIGHGDAREFLSGLALFFLRRTKTSVCLQKGTRSPPEYGSATAWLCDPPRLSLRSLSSVCSPRNTRELRLRNEVNPVHT
jgi:hypothetical protein